MALNDRELIDEVGRIRNTAFDIRVYFRALFSQLLPDDLLTVDGLTVVNELINESTLHHAMAKDYPNQNYVLFFYEHAPHSHATSPFFPREPRAHTSLLLGNVRNGKIDQLLNIDGFHSTSYVDILGERTGATPNALIKHRLVIGIKERGASLLMCPLQAASWRDMNCVLYAFAFVKRIIEIFRTTPKLITDVFPLDKLKKSSDVALTALGDGILEGMHGIYVKRDNGCLVLDPAARDAYHKSSRETLAETVMLNYAIECSLKKGGLEGGGTTPSSPLSEGSIFKPIQSTPLSHFNAQKPSGFSTTQVGAIQKVILKLRAEYNSAWPYPNKGRKKIKMDALTDLLEMANTMAPIDAIDRIEKIKGVRDGAISTRTAVLLDKLRYDLGSSCSKHP